MKNDTSYDIQMHATHIVDNYQYEKKRRGERTNMLLCVALCGILSAMFIGILLFFAAYLPPPV